MRISLISLPKLLGWITENSMKTGGIPRRISNLTENGISQCIFSCTGTCTWRWLSGINCLKVRHKWSHSCLVLLYMSFYWPWFLELWGQFSWLSLWGRSRLYTWQDLWEARNQGHFYSGLALSAGRASLWHRIWGFMRVLLGILLEIDTSILFFVIYKCFVHS